MLWQLPGNFKRDDERLASALELLPEGRHCFEFRHPSWFTAPVYRLLGDHDAALVIADDPERPFTTRELTAVVDASSASTAAATAAAATTPTPSWPRGGGGSRRGASRAEVFAYLNNDWEAFAPAQRADPVGPLALVRLAASAADSGWAVLPTTIDVVRVATIDMGTNSTRLLVADVDDDGCAEAVHRESRVTGLGRGARDVGPALRRRRRGVLDAVGDYLAIAAELGAVETTAFATSAVRDATNGDAFLAELRERFSLDARVIDGLEEARLTYRGALSDCADGSPGRRTLVVDIGGGSTELILGSGPEPDFHTSLQLGVVRHSERHVHADPPRTEELEALSKDVGAIIDGELAAHPGLKAERAIAVAGTPATLAAIELGLERFDPATVEGHDLSLESVQQSCSRLASLPLEERKAVVGVDPDRAPTIVAGVVILIKAMRAFGLSRVEVSERDILYGAALETADRCRNGVPG